MSLTSVEERELARLVV